MAKIICIANQKGGVGKTSTAINLGASIALNKKKTLIIDMDPQGNAGSGMGVSIKNGMSIYHALVDNKKIHTLVQETPVENLHFIASNIDLTGAEIELVNMEEREYRLRKSLEEIHSGFDYILVDCPPSLGLLTVNSLVASHSVLIPLQCEYYALEGLSQLLNTVKLVKNRLNEQLRLEGILLTMFDKRNNLSHQVAHEITTHFSQYVFSVVIPRTVRLAEAPSHGKPICLYDNISIGSQRYRELAECILQREGQAS
jgi:chromosome partitioning protein